MSVTANKVLAKAKSQLGIMESPAGSNNVKYNTWYYGRRVYGSSYAWCSVFLAWCFYQCEKNNKTFPRNANAAYAQDEVVSKCGGKWIMRKTASTATKRAGCAKMKAGDIVTFDFGANDGYRRHIGIFAYKKNGYYYCYEGNTSISGSQSNGGRVCLKVRRYIDICAIARPNYDVKKVAKKTTKKKAIVKKNNKTKKSVPKIYINAGHSNTDTGAVSKYGVERKFNVKVRNAMVNYLEKNYHCEVKWNKGTVGDLKKITDEANKWGADLYVSIHFNACESHKADGFEALVYNKERDKLANIFIKHIKAIGQNSRGIRYRQDLLNLKLTKMPAILCECAYIDNRKDIKDWNDDSELTKMGKALAKAAVEYLGIKKK